MEKEIEIWKDIPGWETYYQISSFGSLKRLPVKIDTISRCGNPYQKIFRERVRKPHLNRDGYFYIGLNMSKIRKTLKIHRLVAETFLSSVQGKTHVDHIDGNKQNNHYLNLRWCTHAENITFGWGIGLYNNIGSKHGMAILTEEKVMAIKKDLALGLKGVTIASQYNVCASTISDIKKGRTWNHV